MPIYEYRCGACGRISSVFFRSVRAVSAPHCPHCGSGDMERKISPVVYLKGSERLREVDINRLLADSGGPDKRRQAHWARRVAGELGGELGAHYREMAERAEAGENVPELYAPEMDLPGDIERASSKGSDAANDPWA